MSSHHDAGRFLLNPVQTPALDPEQAGTAGSFKGEWWIVATAALTTVLAPLNSTMIIVALPSIARNLHSSLGTVSWLVTSYLIVMAALQPIAGKLGDRLGRRPLVLAGLIYFAVASAAAAFAPTLPLLITFRVQQAIAAALCLPNVAALVRQLTPRERRGAVFGVIGAVTGIGAAAGPTLGGVLTQAFGWQAIFSVNLLPVAAALFLSLRTIPRLRESSSLPFDLLGAVLLTVLLTSLALLFSEGLRHATVLLLPAAALFILVLLLFLRRELRVADPVLPPHLYRHQTFAATSVIIAASNLALYSTLVIIPVVLARRGFTPGETGLLLAAFTGPNVLGAALGGRLADIFGRRAPSVVGLSIYALTLVPLVVAGEHIPLAVLALVLAGGGLSVGASWPGVQAASVESVSVAEAGMASGLFSTSRYLGSIVGTSVLGALLAQGGNPRLAFWMILFAALVSAVASPAIHPRPEARSAQSAAI